MSETFKPIETQEAFDAAIAERLERDRKKYAGQIETDLKSKGWKSPEEVTQLTADLNKQIKTLQDTAADTARTIADKDKEIAKGEGYRAELEKTRIAIAAGLDIDMAGRLQGANAKEWEADAKKLSDQFAAFAQNQNQPAPIGNPGGKAKSTGSPWASINTQLSE